MLAQRFGLGTLDAASPEDIEGLGCLTAIGEDLSLKNNDELTGINGLEGLTSVGGDLALQYNDALASLSSLENIISIGGTVYIDTAAEREAGGEGGTGGVAAAARERVTPPTELGCQALPPSWATLEPGTFILPSPDGAADVGELAAARPVRGPDLWPRVLGRIAHDKSSSGGGAICRLAARRTVR